MQTFIQWHILVKAFRARRMHLAATHPLRGADRTLARIASAFLCPWLLTATAHLTARFRLASAEMCVRHLARVGLVHQVGVNGNFEDAGWKIRLLLEFLTLDVVYV